MITRDTVDYIMSRLTRPTRFYTTKRLKTRANRSHDMDVVGVSKLTTTLCHVIECSTLTQR